MELIYAIIKLVTALCGLISAVLAALKARGSSRDNRNGRK